MARVDNLTREMPANSPDKVKWAKLRELPERDAQDERIRHIAQLLREAAGPRQSAFVALVHSLARDGIRYVSDTVRTGGEDIMGLTRPYTDALEAYERGADDCDAKARFVVALLIAGGQRAQMVAWWDRKTGELAHVSGEVHVGGNWKHLETILSRARLGDEPNDVPPESATGAWRYS